MLKRPVLWIALGLLSLVLSAAAYRGFPLAFSLVSIDISMDRAHALQAARAIAARQRFGTAAYQEAASFELDDETQTFVELEGGGKAAFTEMLRKGLYLAYTWRVRQFREGDVHETTIALAPDGRPYGFVEKVREDAPGAALDSDAARQIAERDARTNWAIDFSEYQLIERGQTVRPGGRVDHTFTYERPSPTLNDGRYRLRLVISGDRLTEVTHFVKVPEAFLRRYDSMRAANTTLGLVSVIGLIVLYGLGGIGVGLFAMSRIRWVVWRPAAIWGIGIALLQSLIAVNEWPLAWMDYNTADTRTLFFTEQALAIVASFVSFSLIYTASFMAAETLTRRAFRSHPQLWHAWSQRAGASVEMLGRTAAGYLLVALFFAYDVGLYAVATHRLGWWAPSEALFHPDVLAAYLPWFSAIANSLQAGFWEECLFRAVPIAGAALIGDWLGYRRTAIVIAFVVQAVIFGSGHAPYPNEPFFARPVELIVPSIGFGLLYLYFGLVPGIILHFTFDTTWFALPLFVAHAPGIWIQRVMVVVVVLVPLWVVFYRRARAGRWTRLEAADRNGAWVPPPQPVRTVPLPSRAAAPATAPRAEWIWLLLGAAGLAACVVGVTQYGPSATLTISRSEAITVVRQALAARGFTPGASWRLLALPDNGASGPQEFVSQTAGERRRKAFIGTFLPAPRWNVRVATFEGDLTARAEEWRVFVPNDGVAWPIIHDLPETRPGASLDENQARSLVAQTLVNELHVDLSRGDLKEVSATPTKRPARTDWTFVFTDRTVPPLPQGEPRVRVELAGNEVTSVGRFIFTPEAWDREASATQTRDIIVQVATALVPVGALIALAVLAVIAWSRRRFVPRLFVIALAQLLVVAALSYVNNWPTSVAFLSTSQPYSLQVGALVGAGGVSVLLAATVPALVIGVLPIGLSQSGSMSDRTAVRLGVAAALIALGVLFGATWLKTPVWASASDLTPLGTFWPILAVVLTAVTKLLTRMALIVGVLIALGQHTSGWTRRQLSGFVAVGLVGWAAAGAPDGSAVAGWAVAGLGCGVALAVVAVLLLNRDLTVVPIVLGVLGAGELLLTGVARAYPGALTSSVVAALVVLLFAWYWFRALRQSRDLLVSEAAAVAAA